ncbi:MAG: hypothetical protein JWM26_2316 [Betaproteobacteria bacterium]|nr:hypothetical protein [Betaproteobacteria bacterium]
MTTSPQQTVYTKTAKGILELRNKSARLSRELAVVFQSVDGKATVTELLPKSGMTAPQLHQALNTLVSDGYIKTVAVAPPQAAGDDPDVEFDSSAEATRLRMEAASHALAGADAARLAQQQARAALEAKLRAEAEGRARALAEARALSEAEAPADPRFENLAHRLTARVHSERVARDEAGRRSRAGGDTDASGARADTNTFPSLEFLSEAGNAPAPRRDNPPAPAASAAGADPGLPTISLGAGAGRGDVKHITPDHVPSALERAMTARTAQSEADADKNAGAITPPPTPRPVPPARTAAPDRIAPGETQLALAEDTDWSAQRTAPAAASTPAPSAAAGNAPMPTLDDDDPLQERLNVDRAAHDLIAESAAKRREADVLALGRDAMDKRRQRQADDARRAEFSLREKQRRRVARALGIAAIGVPAFAILWLQFMPLNGYVHQAERALSERLNQPTTISTLRYVLFPTPRVVLEGVRIGAAHGIHVERVDAHAWPTAFISGPLVFDTVEAKGVGMDPGMLGLIPTWTGGRSAGAVHSTRLKLIDVKLRGADAKVGGMSGEVSFAANGTVNQAVLANENLKLEIAPRQNGVRVVLDAQDWRAPFGPAFAFSHLRLEGIADRQQFATTTLSGRIGGGDLTGTLAARWEGPMIVGGEFTLQGARLDDLISGLSAGFRAKGVLNAKARYAMQADSASGLMEKPLLEGTFAVTRGELTGIDLVRAVQTGGGALNGGRTAFDELKGSVQLNGGRYSYRDLRLSSGPLEATGYVDVAPGGQLSGRVNAALSSRSAVMARGTYTVAGTVKDPKLER